MKLKTIPAGIYSANCYIIMDDETKDTAVIDPGGDAEDLIRAIKDTGAQVKFILLTHGHIDHTDAAVQIKEEFNVPIYISQEDYNICEKGEYIFGNISGNIDKYIKEHDTFRLGHKEIKAIHTPGHTPGGMCFLVNEMIFTGDTLFAGSIGRTDFIGGDFDTIIKSIKEKLMILPDNITVLPGHGPKSTIGEERTHNPFL
ncbi:MBL fold metallo-hydrolase [Clostridium sp. DJ247]|uniref:MBL fold metallo-hydrolase n=1 Tax=Clostridium sp. DJ247 TaxID=2726188 RepID=UPI001629BD05|nr:MBL fold metallo-hydrolase [Clostridium sp. DJ247]MBC2581140.1 MBL fold metallo-hydrolase [Clostridium sp. DJ247]